MNDVLHSPNVQAETQYIQITQLILEDLITPKKWKLWLQKNVS